MIFRLVINHRKSFENQPVPFPSFLSDAYMAGDRLKTGIMGRDRDSPSVKSRSNNAVVLVSGKIGYGERFTEF
jgi:hypothetical protein